MPLKTALSRTCDRPTNASGPTKSSPRVKPGTCAIVRHVPALQIDVSQAPVAGLEQPQPAAVPPRRVRHRQPAEQDLARLHVHQDAAAGLVRAPAARRVGLAQRGDVLRAGRRPCARPLRWQRSSGASARDERRPPARLRSCARASSVQRQEKRVLTTHSSPPRSQAISWIWMSPVTWRRRGRKQASCVPAARACRDGRLLRYSQTVLAPPIASRARSAARPIGLGRCGSGC